MTLQHYHNTFPMSDDICRLCNREIDDGKGTIIAESFDDGIPVHKECFEEGKEER